MDGALFERLGSELFAAGRTGTAVDPLTERYPNITVEEAYAVQRHAVGLHLAAGGRVTGRKIGLTSKAMQSMFGVYEPDFGCLLDALAYDPGTEIALDTLIQPRVEGEIAFVLKKDLAGRKITVRDVLDATAYVTAAIEIVDSRFHNWKIKLQDTVADNASFGAYVLGSRACRVDDIDLRLVGMVMEQNGAVVGTGAGAAAMGHPAACVAWLANRMSQLGDPLRAGDIVLSGALTAAVDATPGDRFSIMFDRLGEVSIAFR